MLVLPAIVILMYGVVQDAKHLVTWKFLELKAQKSTFKSRYFLFSALYQKYYARIYLIITNVLEESATSIFRVFTLKQHCISEKSSLDIHACKNLISFCEIDYIGLMDSFKTQTYVWHPLIISQENASLK
jgi:hypothetical protein